MTKHIQTRSTCTALLLTTMALPLAAQETTLTAERATKTVILDEVAVRNLRIETEAVTKRTFESTVFAVGRIEEIPAKRFSVSSRIAGRAVEINAFVGDHVKKGDILVRVESRQPGDPPPTIALEAIQDGLVVDTHVLTGQPVDPEQDLLDIADRSEMWAVARIPERAAARVKPGTHARIVVPALGGEAIDTVLLRYGVTADDQAGTIEGVFVIPNADGRLLPGMRAEFSFIVAQRPEVLAAPRNAVQGDPASRVVYVRDFDIPNAFVRAPVVLGEENDHYVEVLSGLFPGDEIVTRGAYPLGFVGAGSGPSLKEALDAAHGHEHNEDGTRKTASSDDAHGDHAEYDDAHLSWPLLAYSVLITLIAALLYRRVRALSAAHSQD